MIALIQRVTSGKVSINQKIYSEIAAGYVILVGIFQNDSEKDIDPIVEKVINLRIMSDQKDKMNLSIQDTQGEILLVSQFTLCADIAKGRRPSFIKAMNPVEAKRLYELMATHFEEKGIKVKTGEFGAMMNVEIHNDGPVTIIVDSKELS